MTNKLQLAFGSFFVITLAAAVVGASKRIDTAERSRHEIQAGEPTEGSLLVLDPYGKHTGAACPLKRTDVRAEISGFLARVDVTQQFENNTGAKIEAVYTFPLPQRAAVDEMVMKVGERTVKAVIKKRDEARKIFEQARAQGHVASLLEQERPNIFTQSVTNIESGAKVTVTISYVETLQYEEGSYEFSFPMVVGPRYIPGNATGRQGTGWAPDTDRVPDASRITPKYARPETRAGHDLTLEVSLDAGVPIDGLRSTTHEILVDRPAAPKAHVRLKQQAVIPNKDFVLRYDVAGVKVQDALLAHRGEKGGFFTFILQPPERVTAEDVTPKELVFVIDTSGSMSGFPIEKAKETMKLALNGLYPRDTFNLITFAGDTRILFSQPVPATAENLSRAQQFLAGTYGSGGTEMMKAIRAALDSSDESGKVRIVCFMTDGYVGNDFEIIGEVKKHPNARVFSFGIGSSVNRFLLDKMAEEGRGEVEYVGLNDDGSAAARRFHERVRNPLLTDVTLEWVGVATADVYPQRIPDLFGAKPVVVSGRYTAPSAGKLILRGRMSGKPYVRNIAVNFPSHEPAHDVLATLWARTKIDDLMRRDYQGMQQGRPLVEIEQEITRLGLEYRLMTQFTSFVAVEEKTVTREGKPVVVEVPVEMPDGVSHQGVFGANAAREMAAGPMAFQVMKSAAQSTTPMPRTAGVVGGAADAVNSINLPAERKRRDERDKVKTELEKDAKKLDAALAAMIATAAPSDKVEVEIWLSEATPGLIEKLKQLGFEQTAEPKVAKIRRGRIRTDKLGEVAALAEVLAIRKAA